MSMLMSDALKDRVSITDQQADEVDAISQNIAQVVILASRDRAIVGTLKYFRVENNQITMEIAGSIGPCMDLFADCSNKTISIEHLEIHLGDRHVVSWDHINDVVGYSVADVDPVNEMLTFGLKLNIGARTIT